MNLCMTSGTSIHTVLNCVVLLVDTSISEGLHNCRDSHKTSPIAQISRHINPVLLVLRLDNGMNLYKTQSYEIYQIGDVRG
jgi:hypothetical protein